MRLDDLEAKLSPAIGAYIKDVYPSLQDKPYPEVICLEDKQFKAFLKVRDTATTVKAAYSIPTNVLYFRSRPGETAVAHETEHWAQAQRVGPDVYIEQIQALDTFLKYEKSADDVALANAHKLTGKY